MDRLYQALPILFTWELVFLPLAVVALNFRCKVAEREFRVLEEERRLLILKAEKGKVDEVVEARGGSEDVPLPGDEKMQGDVYAPAVPPPV